MRTLKLTVAYDGTELAGWQRQASGRTVQGLLEDALTRIEGGPVSVVGSGRTDAGVHASGQVASVSVTNRLDPLTLRHALNANLPTDVRVLDVAEAPAGFDARRDAAQKTYEYRILNGVIASPFTRRFVWLVPQPLDIDAMARAAARLVGRHDFASFQSTGSSAATTCRTIRESQLVQDGPRELAERFSPIPMIAPADDASSVRLRYRIAGDGFLRHMVRTIVGTLVEIGLGRREADSVGAIMEARDRAEAGPTAPAHGLCLVRVEYSSVASGH
ncbi:MAG: tRNA pseudouridine(38-40) synthase TruA [Acidobacteria bacterium]|nr:tRNA pseudouridine(38-40) synthase TruA [Acidobacteriota bacterium]MBI3264907.1 tRNA pseudouridine(38-40) synthase TruA [Acidobacteriota bacterium]